MTRYGITDTGFVKKPYSAVINSLHDNAKRMFGSDVDLTPGSPIKILIDLYAVEIVGLWLQAEACYNSAFLNTATGYALDNIGKLVGADRTTGIYATGTVTFFRTTALPSPGNSRIIQSGTKVATASINAKEYITTDTVYFEPAITTETHVISEPCYSINAVNIIHSIQALYDETAHDYTGNITFSGRTITFTQQINAGTTIYIDYKPLSITAPIIAVDKGADGNVAANVITLLDTPIDFIHYISNEEGLDSGADVESDSHFRNTIVGATKSVGKATTNALKYYIGKVTGVKNVIIEDPLRAVITDTVDGNGTTSFFVPHIPIYDITSITGSVTGAFTIEGYDARSGEIEVTVATDASETLTIVYTYTVPGQIKIYVEGGNTGDEFTPDTVVYAIETTRAAGIKAIGYDTGDPAAYGSSTAKFSWFYRPNNAYIDLNITIYFDAASTLSEDAKGVVCTQVVENLTQYIDELELHEKIYKNKLLQIVIGTNSDIVDAQLTGWDINDVTADVADLYIQAGVMEITIASDIVITQAIG